MKNEEKKSDVLYVCLCVPLRPLRLNLFWKYLAMNEKAANTTFVQPQILVLLHFLTKSEVSLTFCPVKG
ncbi:MAG TPA: hypothetical protein PKE58_21740, partial [Acidobacteriota bacterium]|nr:hypothetical protein [Acidobacteriota bacterium]